MFRDFRGTIEDQQSMQRKIFIDLSDLIVHASNFDQISGVQRVEIELLKLISSKYPFIEITNAFDAGSKSFRYSATHFANDKAVLFERLKNEFSYCNLNLARKSPKTPGVMIKAVLADITRFFSVKLPKFEQGDIVFIPGGFGFADRILAFYRKLAARGARLVFLSHDSFPITQPDLSAQGVGRFFEPAFFLPAEIITTTQFNAVDFGRAREIVTKTPVPSHIHIVPLAHEFPGAPRNAAPGNPPPRLAARLRDQPFVLCVGTVEIRKNHIRLFDAWRALTLELGDTLPTLVIAGRRGWKAEAALAVLDRAVEDNETICFIEEPSDEELKWLYASCTFSILPSLAEGWGLPIGESLWFGKCCAASNRTSMPEVGHELCVYFDPDSIEEMKGAMRQLLDPAIRKTFEDKIGTAILRTWADVANDLVAVLLQLAEAPPV
jgi:glycosyltransferase involved in cell wall biosynthesis